ncbi:MAG: lysine exporter LysO family protein [Muribaculaceae bacterium]|nr:lysine exporter LysO family protein [Muribaculaceae bacterium]
MKGSLITILCFAGGCIAGLFISGSGSIHTISLWLLYLLMLQAGLSIGINPQLAKIIKSFSPRLLLLPLATVAGAIALSALAGVILSRWSIAQCMAAGSACGYYSLSSILIRQLTEPTIGPALAAELATVALLANILRELFALVAAPLIVKHIGPEAEIAAAGVTSVDVCFPAIKRWCGDSYIGLAILNGVLIDICTPFFISFFCSL